MAFLKYADATIERSGVEPKAWNTVRQAAAPLLKVPVSNILPDFSAKDYLLSHCTIVASVDVEDNGFYIKEACSKYVNDNSDAWERVLLGLTYPSFVGAQNYLEHVQIPSLSKGRIIDAVARPINNNESTYIDILVATERKHRELVAKIETGAIKTLSMGCSIKYSFCSKCGNKAEDETQLCTCIRYLKGNYFTDPNGIRRIIAELCGHKDDPGSNTFIEASWVENPAFKGAVLRNIIELHGADETRMAAKIEEAYTKPKESDLDAFLKAASVQSLVDIKKNVDTLLQSKVATMPGHPEQEYRERQKKLIPFGTEVDDPQEDSGELQIQEAPPPIEQMAPPSDSPAVPAQPPQSAPEQAAAPISQPAPEQPPAAPQEDMSPDPQMEQDMAAQLGPDGGSQAPGEDPAAAGPGGQQPEDQPADSFDSLVKQVKKNIRTRVIEELQKELDEQKINELNNIDNTKINYGMNNNENLVTAFVDIYKPKTNYSKSKLASIFKMLVASENGEDFRKLAFSNRDLIDFFEFVDRFQVSENSLNPRDYALLRTATKSDLATFDEFMSFLNKNGISNKQVIKRICAKAKFFIR